MTRVTKRNVPGQSGTYVPLPASPTDGQLLTWSAAQSAWVAATSTNMVDAGSIINQSTTATTITAGATTDIPSTSKAFALNGTRELWLSAHVTGGPTAAPSAAAFLALNIAEISNGTDTPLTFSGCAVVTASGQFSTVVIPPVKVGLLARTRTFKLTFGCSGSFNATVLNTAAFPSILRGEWR